MVEVISDFRQEDGETGRLADIFQKPNDVPAAGPSALTRVRRKPKPRAKKDQNKEYILAIRSHAERRRLIAERAAAILSEEANIRTILPKKSKYFQRQHFRIVKRNICVRKFVLELSLNFLSELTLDPDPDPDLDTNWTKIHYPYPN